MQGTNKGVQILNVINGNFNAFTSGSNRMQSKTKMSKQQKYSYKDVTAQNLRRYTEGGNNKPEKQTTEHKLK
jgi:hypothetical protein